MKTRAALLSILLFFTAFCHGQTLQTGRNHFQAGRYEAALPIMQKYLKQSPNDRPRNYWYGVCLFETGQKDECLPYLMKASDRIVRAYRYIGKYYEYKEDYASAIDWYDRFVEGSRADSDIHDAELEAQVEHTADSLRHLFRMLRSTEKICFIDSFTVSKEDLFNTYLLGDETGAIGKYSDYFDDASQGEVFIPEMGNTIIYSHLDNDSIFRLYKAYRSYDKWVDAVSAQVPAEGNLRYPFMENDGQTLYFASDADGTLGGYDLYVTRYNPSTGRYLTPQSLSMPFNSDANDYMYAVDETNGLGWFATDRRQPADTVAIYVFVLDDSRSRYQYEGGDTMAIHRAARLISIAETQTDMEKLRAGIQSLTRLKYSVNDTQQVHYDFTFVIDDLTDYHKVSDFRSPEARSLFTSWQQLKVTYASDKEQLKALRDRFATASDNEKAQLRERILPLEQRVLDEETRIDADEIRIRNTEIEHISR